MNYKDVLIEKINNLLSGKWTVPEFEKEYYLYYLEEVPGDALSLYQDTFYGLVQEKLDWTSENPTQQDKNDGWFDYNEYIDWLKINTQRFKESEDKWYDDYIKDFEE